MNETEVRQTVIELLRKIAPGTAPEQLKPDDDIRHALEIDSFDTLQFIVALDEHFGIETPEADYGRIATLKNLVNYIMAKKP
jgi:acyl carrier protein